MVKLTIYKDGFKGWYCDNNKYFFKIEYISGAKYWYNRDDDSDNDGSLLVGCSSNDEYYKLMKLKVLW